MRAILAIVSGNVGVWAFVLLVKPAPNFGKVAPALCIP